MTYFIGIDPGQKGALAFVRFDPYLSMLVMPMPMAGKDIDLAAIAKSVDGYRHLPLIAVVEKVGAMPKQGVTSTFTFGKGFGGILGVLAALKVHVELVTPRKWKGSVLAGFDDKDKKAAIAYCRRAWPEINLIPERCRVPHDGIADALCLAEYGRRTFTTKETP